MSTPSNGAPVLQTDSLVAGYTDVDILHGVSITVGAGEIVSIIGPNGAGKSTTIKAIAGLLELRGGTVSFNGTDVTRARPHKLAALGIGYVPQLDNVFPNMTIEENLEIGATVRPTRARALMDQIYDLFPILRERRRARGATLSGGQRQMLALGRAMMAEPALLMLDEPSAGLAPLVVDEIFEVIARINRSGPAILLVEQNARRALAMSDRGYVLDLGKNRFEGPGEDLLHDPKIAELYLGGGRRLDVESAEDEGHP